MIYLVIDKTESLLINSGLGEVCYGFELNDCFAKIGAERNELCSLYNELREKYINKVFDGHTVKITIPVTSRTLKIIINAIKETYRELTDIYDEFTTRTGVLNEEALQILAKYEKICAEHENAGMN